MRFDWPSSIAGWPFLCHWPPLNDGTWTYTWQNGRQLQKMQKSGETVEFVYNENGLRVQKTATTTGVTKYTLHGKNIVHMTQGNNELHFFYDTRNKPAVVVYNDAPYSYVKNLQGDIVALLDSNKNVVVSYVYDAWGRPISKTGSMAGTLGTVQPFRYRGYVYDEETELYYLETRFYSSNHCGFINSDLVYHLGQDDTTGTFNLFAYCSNNPTIRKDSSGLAFETIWDAISLGASVVEVIGNPFDPWAWIGLAGDAADLLIPFVGGIGETTRALKAASGAAEVLDSAVDASKATRKGWQVGQDITALTRAGNTPSWSTLRSRYWKNKAHYFPEEYALKPGENGIDNLARMRAGKAPIFGTGDDAYSMELHHMLGREGDNYYLFFEVSPEDHAKIDPFRHTGK